MVGKMTQVVALLSLLVFTAIMVGIGLYSRKFTKTIDGFLLGGRNVGAWMSAFAYGTTYFSAVIFIGYAGKHGWDIGFGSMWIGIGNAFLGCLLSWKLMAKKTREMTHRLNAKTMPEFFQARYGSKAMKIYSALIIFIFLVPYAASVYKGLGLLFSTTFPSLSKISEYGATLPEGFMHSLLTFLTPTVICMAIVAILTAIYLVLGGYVATAITDFVQGIIMVVGVFVLIFSIVYSPQVGGFVNGVRQLREIEPKLLHPFGAGAWSFLLFNILLTSIGPLGLPQMVHKYYAIKDEEAIKKGTIISTAFALIIGCGAYFIGSFGRVVLNNQLPEAGGYDAVVPSMLIEAFGGSIVSNILLSLILLLVLSASMSTLSSIVLTSSSAITVDLLEEYKPNVDKKKQVVVLRLFCLLFVLLSFIFASMNISIIVSIMSFSWGVVSGCFIGPFIWGLYSKKVTKAGAWSGLLSGLVTVLCLVVYTTLTSEGGFAQAISNSPVYGVVAMIVSLVIVPVVSKFTKPVELDIAEADFGAVTE